MQDDMLRHAAKLWATLGFVGVGCASNVEDKSQGGAGSVAFEQTCLQLLLATECC